MIILFYNLSNTELTTEHIKKYIEIFKSQYLPKLKTNKAYYDAKNPPIMNRVMADPDKPNNKIATAYSRYITTLINGYFLGGKAINYTIPDEQLDAIINANKETEQSHNIDIGKNCSIYGICYELLYLNNNKQLKMTILNPETVIPIYSNDIDGDLLYCIRFWDETNVLDNKTTTNIELYTNTDIKIFKMENNSISLVEVKEHYFKTCPINVFKNNNDMTGDSECVFKLIDGLDIALSDTANFRQELNDSYLCIFNGNLSDSDLRLMKSNRIFSIDSDENNSAKIEWLNKDSNDTENENYKDRLENMIKKFSFVQDLETIATSHVSAESIKNGSYGIEGIVSEKESQFKQSLFRRLQLICNIYNLFGNDFTTDGIKIQFFRNIAKNLSVISDNVSKLASTVSRKSLLQQIPFITDINAELKQIEEEQKQNYHNEIIQDN